MLGENRKELGRVSRVHFGLQDHGILTLDIALDFGGTGQSFGGYALDTWDAAKNRRVGHPAGTDFVLQMLDLFGVQTLDDIKGRTVYALRDDRSLIVGLELPPFDGGRKFMVEEWRREWFGGSNG